MTEEELLASYRRLSDDGKRQIEMLIIAMELSAKKESSEGDE